MAKIVDQTCHCDIFDVATSNTVVTSILSIALIELLSYIEQKFHLFLREMPNSKTVGKSCMRRSRKNVV